MRKLGARAKRNQNKRKEGEVEGNACMHAIYHLTCDQALFSRESQCKREKKEKGHADIFIRQVTLTKVKLPPYSGYLMEDRIFCKFDYLRLCWATEPNRSIKFDCFRLQNTFD